VSCAQVLWFINSILFNEVLLCTQFCSTTKAMDLKVHMGNIDRWIQEEGGLWLEVSPLTPAVWHVVCRVSCVVCRVSCVPRDCVR